ncbi:hypothetical protein PY093_06400 [Cytobacillus sp. S13-E01]|uniref:hypothetical protein n=1 Tax=Cytobacillus sp. S13-E01 TaxID=3031326 RepID=UPI0023D7CB85|nr:hypothetical protein [Cytobacillus sp. S13-E01]MDF0726345.1 hypothetical protein [Cytobacillus sp. S13-E01]
MSNNNQFDHQGEAYENIPNLDVQNSKKNLFHTLQKHLDVLHTEFTNDYPYEVRQAIKSRIAELERTSTSLQNDFDKVRD